MFFEEMDYLMGKTLGNVRILDDQIMECLLQGIFPTSIVQRGIPLLLATVHVLIVHGHKRLLGQTGTQLGQLHCQKLGIFPVNI
jgi:hypothetical protein